MKNKIKIYILLYIQIIAYLYGYYAPKKITNSGNSSTRIKQTYRFDQIPDDGSYTLSVEDISGNIKLKGHEGSGAKLIITRIAHGIPEGEIEEVHKLARSFITHSEDEELVIISGEEKTQNRGHIESIFELEFPKNVNLNIKLIGGDIDIYGINGEGIFETKGGDISIELYKGRLDAITDGGEINIKNTEGIIRAHSLGSDLRVIDLRGEIYLSSIGGNIDLDQVNGTTDVQVTGGSINLSNIEGGKIGCRTSGGPIKGENMSGIISMKSSGSDIEVSDLDGEISLMTSGGHIIIDSLVGSLACEASSGNIDMKKIIGSVDCLTSAGDIELELIYDSFIKEKSIHMETHLGDAIINIPEGLAGNIKSTIYQASSEKDLNSEIPLLINIDEKKVTGEGMVGGGTVPINIEVYNGSITIKQD